MEVRLSPHSEAQLERIALRTGTPPEQLVANAVSGYLEAEARFVAAVERGIAAADRGELLDETQMDARIETMFPRSAGRACAYVNR